MLIFRWGIASAADPLPEGGLGNANLICSWPSGPFPEFLSTFLPNKKHLAKNSSRRKKKQMQPSGISSFLPARKKERSHCRPDPGSGISPECTVDNALLAFYVILSSRMIAVGRKIQTSPSGFLSTFLPKTNRSRKTGPWRKKNKFGSCFSFFLRTGN